MTPQTLFCHLFIFYHLGVWNIDVGRFSDHNQYAHKISWESVKLFRMTNENGKTNIVTREFYIKDNSKFQSCGETHFLFEIHSLYDNNCYSDKTKLGEHISIYLIAPKLARLLKSKCLLMIIIIISLLQSTAGRRPAPRYATRPDLEMYILGESTI